MTAPVAESNSTARAATALAVVTLVAIAAAIFWRFSAQASPTERARKLMTDVGAELYDRPLTDAELDAPLQANPKAVRPGPGDVGQPSAARALPANLRQLTLQNDLILLHFWASWCPPCIEELPEIAAVAAALDKSKCKVVGVSYDDDWDAAEGALARIGGSANLGGTWTRDPQGQSGDPAKMLRMFLGTEKLPETWVIRRGQVVGRFIAGQKWTQPRLQRLLSLLCPPVAAPTGGTL